jgi:ketosteroid isomerase-like protein
MTAERGWAAAARDQDLDRSLSYMADDATMLPPSGGPVVARSVYTIRATDGTLQTLHAMGVAIWRKEPGGSWRCVIDIWNEASPRADAPGP